MGALATPTRGTVRLDGRPVGGLRPRERAAIRTSMVGFVFPSFNLLAHLSVYQNVALPAVLANRRPREHAPTVFHLLDLVGMGNKTDHRATTLSGGEKQRVALAAWRSATTASRKFGVRTRRASFTSSPTRRPRRRPWRRVSGPSSAQSTQTCGR
jgi:ABC-type lipoprotein export system ATPase subunit